MGANGETGGIKDCRTEFSSYLRFTQLNGKTFTKSVLLCPMFAVFVSSYRFILPPIFFFLLVFVVVAAAVAVFALHILLFGMV